jgi:hypothetical protein
VIDNWEVCVPTRDAAEKERRSLSVAGTHITSPIQGAIKNGFFAGVALAPKVRVGSESS